MSKLCDLHTDSARIRDALDDLIAAWQVTSEAWNDEVSRRFAERHLDPIGPKFKTALDAMARMTQLVDQMVRECEQ